MYTPTYTHAFITVLTLYHSYLRNILFAKVCVCVFLLNLPYQEPEAVTKVRIRIRTVTYEEYGLQHTKK